MQKYTDIILSPLGTPIGGAVITVTNYPSNTPATIYATDGGSAVDSVMSDPTGRFAFYAADGHYNLSISGTGITPQVVNDIVLNDPSNDATLAALAASGGSALVGWIRNITGAVKRWISDKLAEQVSVLDFSGVDATGAADSTTGIQTALNSFGSAGGRLYFPPGTYLCSAALVIPKKVTMYGAGRTVSVLSFSHTGDGLQSTWPINSSTGVYIGVRDLGITATNTSNTGGGFVDVGGSYVDLYNARISGFKHQVIFDQTEIASVDLCDFGQGTNSVSGMWLVNGADHTAGAAIGYTNRITVSRCQFNAVSAAQYNVLDDGGVQHTFIDNNFNAGVTGIRAAGVFGLVIDRNEMEGHGNEDIYLADTTLAGAFVGPCAGFAITANTPISGAGGRNITIQNAANGDIRANTFGQAASAINFINGAANQACGVVIEGNSKIVRGSARTSGIFVNGNSVVLRRQIMRQVPVTYISASTASGSVAITPASMEFIRVGSRLQIVNEDGTSAEDTIVRATTGTTFTCTLASAKNANAVVYGYTQQDQEEGTWMPVLGATTANGTHTYSTQAGTWTRRGNQVIAPFSMVVSAKDAALSGTVQILGLPFIAENISNGNFFVNISMFDGITLTGGYSVVGGILLPNTSAIGLRKSGNGVALNVLAATDIPGSTLSIYGTISYTTSAV